MRPTRATVLLTAGLVTLLGLPATAAAAADPADLYVNNQAGCSDTGPGSKTAPFCRLSVAAKLVKPGQTVRIGTATPQEESVVIDRSGEPGKPISFVEDTTSWLLHAGVAGDLSIKGASHVRVSGLTVAGNIRITDSTDIELDTVDHSSGHDTELVVGGASKDVRVLRGALHTTRIEGGAERTLFSRNQIFGFTDSAAVTVQDAPGTVVTNNTITGHCGTPLAVGGGSSGSAVFNNILDVSSYFECPERVQRTGMEMAAGAAVGTRADYNLIVGDAKITLVAYKWAGKSYKEPAQLQAATGQGARDILVPVHWGEGTPEAEFPFIDSADATAPGALVPDVMGQRALDDPWVANTGKNGGFLDRGAWEYPDYLSSVGVEVDKPWAPVGTKVEVRARSDSKWPSTMTYSVDFGDGTAPVTVKQGDGDRAITTHVYGSPGDYTVKVTAISVTGKKVTTEEPVKVTTAAPLTAAFGVDQLLPTSTHPDAMGVEPLTVVLDPTKLTAAPWPVVRADVEFGDGNTARAGELRSFEHTYTTPGSYAMKLTLVDSKGAKSTVGRTVKVDYAPSGYVATEPFRIKDSRTDGKPVVSGLPLDVTLPAHHRIPGHPLSGSMASAVVNVTVTGATEDTHLTVWPSGQQRPATSNVNVRAGGTSSNTVTVPVGGGSLAAHLNSGKADLIVDFVGYYQPNAGDRFSPLAPTRVLDTRTTGGALSAAKTRTVKVAGVNGIPADATAVALNLTGTGAKEQAHVIAYPDPAKRPATSNLNVEPGKDKSNQAIVPVGPNGTITLFTNSGSTHVILDAVGYYGKDGKALFTPVVPKRLADTRTTGKVAPGATTTVAGLPSNALGAVLNVTATDTTAPGFLTAYGSGGTLPGASSLNTLPGRTVPNHVTTPVGPGGKVSIFNSYGGPNHVITDLLGYFTTG
ncbi:PKD domain-containing protein [Streptomyces sp. NPDC056883]|uniref:PKD domain-containing protein n=1 Tax=Streptomyces sp. NPDC056883 TaxID=3345959 RepID=UPI003675C507